MSPCIHTPRQVRKDPHEIIGLKYDTLNRMEQLLRNPREARLPEKLIRRRSILIETPLIR